MSKFDLDLTVGLIRSIREERKRKVKRCAEFIPKAHTCSYCLKQPIATKKLPVEQQLFNLDDYAFANEYFENI